MQRESIYDRMTNAEKEVAKLLRNLDIEWVYEKPVFVWDENNRPRVWTPDFYLKHFGFYIEICSSVEFDYEYRRRIFNNNGIQVIFLHLYKDIEKWRYHLFNYLLKFENLRIIKINKIIKIIP